MNNNNLKGSNVDEQIKKVNKKIYILEKLLEAKGYKYSDAINKTRKNERKDFFNLKYSCGIYHFFYEENNIKYSLYLGKASFGNDGNWYLFNRINQHFQKSQDDTLHGKLAKSYEEEIDNEGAIDILKKNNVYIQFVEIYEKDSDSMNWQEINEEIEEYEKFCIKVLNPKFTDR